MYFLNIDKKSNLFKNVLPIILLISSPIMLEQYGFTLQSPEVSFGLLLMMITFILTYYYLKDNKKLYLLIIIPLLVLCFGIYQSLLNLYVLGALISIYKIGNNYKRNIIKTFIIFLISTILYYIISKLCINIFNIETSSYLTSKIGWTNDILSTLKILAKDIIKVLIGYGNILNLGYTLSLLVLLVLFIKKSNTKMDLLILLLIILSPLLLNFVTGSPLVYRSLFTIPFMVSFIFFEFYDLNKYIKWLFIILIFSQTIHYYLLMTSEYNKYKNDVYISEKIYKDCDANEDTTIYLYGIEKSEENIRVFKGEELGHSFFEWSIDGFELTDYRAQNFMKIHNLNFKLGDKTSIKKDFISEYPNDGYYIKEANNCYVNFGI